tara:strand:+ start:655 stop:1218 length:564 start_codon:yes stop_codon:yes gene_type:complete
MKPKLTIELVPSGSWGANLRGVLSRKGWDILRRWAYERADHICEICGETGFEQGRKHAVEAHEIWTYDDDAKVQTLTGIQALCPRTHQCKHLGRSLKVGAGRLVFPHLEKVNGWSPEQAKAYADLCFLIHAHRSAFEWRVDLSWLASDECPLEKGMVREAYEKAQDEYPNTFIDPDLLGSIEQENSE